MAWTLFGMPKHHPACATNPPQPKQASNVVLQPQWTDRQLDKIRKVRKEGHKWNEYGPIRGTRKLQGAGKPEKNPMATWGLFIHTLYYYEKRNNGFYSSCSKNFFAVSIIISQVQVWNSTFSFVCLFCVKTFNTWLGLSQHR